jgi:hypothetical protein
MILMIHNPDKDKVEVVIRDKEIFISHKCLPIIKILSISRSK